LKKKISTAYEKHKAKIEQDSESDADIKQPSEASKEEERALSDLENIEKQLQKINGLLLSKNPKAKPLKDDFNLNWKNDHKEPSGSFYKKLEKSDVYMKARQKVMNLPTFKDIIK
jgi:hypothetical protein